MEIEVKVSFNRDMKNRALESYLDSVRKDDVSEAPFEQLDNDDINESLDILLDDFSGDFYNIEGFEINNDSVELYFILGSDGVDFAEEFLELLRLSGAKELKAECMLDDQEVVLE
jgi:hypothetical protein